MMIWRTRQAMWAFFALLLLLLPAVLAQEVSSASDTDSDTTEDASTNGDDDIRWIQYNPVDGSDTQYLKDNRRPSLYTGAFGDCLGGSSVNVTRFDAAYYKDNMTVLFHLEGNTGIERESVVMYIGVYAYGENRFELTFNPCGANIQR